MTLYIPELQYKTSMSMLYSASEKSNTTQRFLTPFLLQFLGQGPSTTLNLSLKLVSNNSFLFLPSFDKIDHLSILFCQYPIAQPALPVIGPGFPPTSNNSSMQLDGFDGDSRDPKRPAGVRSESKRPIQLLDLGADAFNCILDHVRYRKLDLWIHDYHSRPAYYYRLLHMLNQDNQGLKHIRHLVMRDWDADSVSAESVDFPDAALLMQLLPKDTLRSVEYVSS